MVLANKLLGIFATVKVQAVRRKRFFFLDANQHSSASAPSIVEAWPSSQAATLSLSEQQLVAKPQRRSTVRSLPLVCACSGACATHALPARSAGSSSAAAIPFSPPVVTTHAAIFANDSPSSNYYHLSPHIRAQVLCSPPRARYVFLT